MTSYIYGGWFVPVVFSPRDPTKWKVKNLKVRMAGARSEKSLINEGAGQSLINKNFAPQGRGAKFKK
jgi:hypothetical protein